MRKVEDLGATLKSAVGAAEGAAADAARVNKDEASAVARTAERLAAANGKLEEV